MHLPLKNIKGCGKAAPFKITRLKMKKYRIISLILAAAMIFAVAAIASSCENKKQNQGVVVDLTTAEPTTATTKKPSATTAAPTTAAPTTATTAVTAPTEPTVTASPTSVTEPIATTVPTTSTTQTAPTTTEATTAGTPVVTPGVLEYDVEDPIVGKIHVKIQNESPIDPPIIKSPNWKDVSRVNLRTECDLIIKGRIVSMQEVCITVLGQPLHRTVLTVDIENQYYAKSNPETSRIRVYCELSSRDTTTDAAMIVVNEEYYFFLENVSGNQNNRLGYENICEYFMTLPPSEDYLISSSATIINDRMIALLQNVDGFADIDPRDNLGYVLRDIFN